MTPVGSGDSALPWAALSFAATVLCFVGLWIGVGALLAIVSGWPRLAKSFPARTRPAGVPLRGQVASFGGVGERNVTGLIVCDDGLFLWAIWLFRPLRPPLLIPWSEIDSVEERRRLWWTVYALDVRGICIIVKRQAFEALQPYLKHSVARA
jgi:hypothetical protein